MKELIVLESILYFILGFLSSALLALMVSPAIWNRAVHLTKRRIESSVPLTLNEIQADKDQLRAEFAMSTRRLELSVEELRDKASRQIIEINRKRDEMAKLSEESDEKIETIRNLETTASELRAQLRERETMLQSASDRYEQLQAKLEEKALEIETVRNQLSSVQSEADSNRIELVAKQTAVQNLNDTVTDFQRKDTQLAEELKAQKREVARLKNVGEAAERKSQEAEKRLARIQRQLADTEEKLERRERDLNQIRQTDSSDNAENSTLNRLVMEEKNRAVELEAKLAQANLQMEALLSDASNDNVEKAISSLREETNETAEKLALANAECERLRKELQVYERDKTDNWDEERRENAILRERINDLAAQVTAMTASIEGKDSPINAILNEDLTQIAVNGGNTAGSDGTNRKVITLADRIRALQETSRGPQT